MNNGDSDGNISEMMSRRSVLAASAAFGMSGLAGCQGILDDVLSDVADSNVRNKFATPAAFYGGDSQPDGTHSEGDYAVTETGLTVSGEFEGVSADVDLHAYVTNSTVRVTDHNAHRSNRLHPSSVGDSDSETRTLVTVLELERGLALQVDSATEVVGRESTEESRTALEGIRSTIEEIRTVLGRGNGGGCTTEVCDILRKNADGRLSETETGITAVEAGEWKQVNQSLRNVGRIVDGDVERLENELGVEVIGAADGLYGYLDGEATIGERFVVTVPDARLKDADLALADELTPARLLTYVTGEEIGPASGSTEQRFQWIDDPPRFSASVTVPDSESYDPGRQLVALGYCLNSKGEDFNSTLQIDHAAGGLTGGGGTSDEDDGFLVSVGLTTRFGWRELAEWGTERDAGEAAVTQTVVGSVLAQPEGCPQPIPALFYCRRIRHAEQYVYAGGWIVDDSALYHDAVTLLVAEEVPEVVHVEHSSESDAMRRTITTGLNRERGQLGSLVYDGELGERALRFLPAPHREEEGRNILVDKASASVRSRNPKTGNEIQIPLDGGAVGPDADPLQVTICPLDNPIAHIRTPAGCANCRSNPDCDCKTNLVPAVNNISSR